MSLPVVLFGLVCAIFAAVGFWDKRKRAKKQAEQKSQFNEAA
jgi:hypothetical protein